MPKTRESDPSEFYKKQIRELKKQIRQLQQQLKQYQKYERSQEEDVSTDTEDTQPKQIESPCLDCGKGKLKYFEIVGKVFTTCDICGDRKRIK